MIYPPESVAEAILYAAEHPKRDMHVGGQAKLWAILGNVAPCLTDKIAEAIMFRGQQSVDRPSKPQDDMHSTNRVTAWKGADGTKVISVQEVTT